MRMCKTCKRIEGDDGQPLRFYSGARSCVPCVMAYQVDKSKREREMVENHPLRYMSQEEIARRWNEKNGMVVEESAIKHMEKMQ